MRDIKIGNHIIPLWLIAIILISGIGAGVLASYVWKTLIIPLEVKEPIEILYYPSELSLFPGETEEFNITVQNHASINYSVILDFYLSNTTYQENYVTFSNEIYVVTSGQQNLPSWLKIESNAPPSNTSLKVELTRLGEATEKLQITQVNFLSSLIRVTINNTGMTSITIKEIWIDNLKQNSTNPSLPATISANSELTLNIIYAWTSSNKYLFKIITSFGNRVYYSAVAPTRVQEENLFLTKQHVWYNTTGSWAEAAIVIINTGGKDVVLDKITVRGQECPWTNVYYWRTNNVTISDDLQVTSTEITGTSFSITIQGQQRNFARANDDLTLKSGWAIVIYIMNPDSIALNDVGITVGITVFTSNAQYYKETNVEAAQ